jgi:hypothetical protein
VIVLGPVPPRDPARSRLARATPLLVPLVFTLSPVVGMVMVSAQVLPAHLPSVARIVICAFTIASVLYFIARRGRDPVTASNIVALPLFLIGMYPAAYTFAEQLTAVRESFVSVPYLVFCCWTAYLAARIPRHAARTVHEVLSIVAAILLALSVWVIGRVYVWPPPDSSDTKQAVAHLSAPLELPTHVSWKPDVYHLVLDGMGRPDVLADRYGVDAGMYLDELRTLGFDVARAQGHANYVQTHLSLASMLNLAYLDELLVAEGTAQNRGPLRDLISRARVPSMFKRLGYQVEFIGSGYVSNGVFLDAEDCDCPQLRYAESEIGAISLTPFESLLHLGFGHRAHYERSLHVFDRFERPRTGARPRYVFAHTMLPHPPFVADEGGRFTNPLKHPSGADASFFMGTADEYRKGYRAQATFVLARTVQSVRRILEASQRDNRDAVVIITGDHGPRFGMDARQPASESGLYTLPVLLAIHWPQRARPDRAPVSLVNVYRTVFRQVFGMDLAPLPDAGFVSPFTAPYAVKRVDGLGSWELEVGSSQ